MKIRQVMALMVGAISMAMAVPAWSIPLENPIGDNYYAVQHFPVINFTGMELNYFGIPRWLSGTSYNTGVFLGWSTPASTYQLNAPGYDNVSFKGNFTLLAQTSPTGAVSFGKFAFTSSDTMFGFGTKQVCDRYGKNCVSQPKSGVVFAGDLNKFGWSTQKSMIEFQTYNLSGWCKTMGWTTTTERLWFNIPGGLDLSAHMAAGKCWSANNVSGTAVVPEPASVLLIGSGFAGLLGLSRCGKTR